MIRVLILTLVLGLTTSSRIIISFKSQKCAELGFSHHDMLLLRASNILFLRNVEMIILDISIYQLSSFLLEFDNFTKCIEDFREDEQILIESPKLRQENTSNSDDKDFYDWQLKRINTISLPLPKFFSRFIRSSNPVHVFLLDSGIYLHADFKHLIAPESQHFSFVEESCCGNVQSDPFCDCNGRGTHNAGLISSVNVGYNPEAFLHSIKISNQNGETTKENIIKGIDKIIEIVKASYPKGINFANLTINFFFDIQINAAANRLIDANIILVGAAGDLNENSCTLSPTNFPAFVIGASDIEDNKTETSSFGDCISMFAPGEKVYSCKPDGGYQFMSGTSTAASFFTGYATAVAAQGNLATPLEVRVAIKKFINKGIVNNTKSRYNDLPFDGSLGN